MCHIELRTLLQAGLALFLSTLVFFAFFVALLYHTLTTMMLGHAEARVAEGADGIGRWGSFTAAYTLTSALAALWTLVLYFMREYRLPLEKRDGRVIAMRRAKRGALIYLPYRGTGSSFTC
jgi:hypothetical protein